MKYRKILTQGQWSHCVESLICCLVLIKPRKTGNCPDMTEKLLIVNHQTYNSFRNIIRVSDGLDPDQDPNCLQRLSAENKSPLARKGLKATDGCRAP